MADTIFSPGTLVTSEWLNEVNRHVYDVPQSGVSTGASLVGFLQAGTGATGLSAQVKMQQSVDVADFGAPTSGDAQAAFTLAVNHVSSLGGGVVTFNKNYSILTNLTIPDNVHLVGELVAAGQIQDGGVGGDYDSLGSTLKIASTATITLGSSASLSNCVVIRSGLDLPFADLAAAQAGVPLFAGTAVTIGGDDAKVENTLFLGFEKAILSTNRNRLRFYNVQGDCTNGIEVSNALDVVYLDQCHFWPFTTANFSWTASDATQAILTRSGIAFHFHTTVDWPKITDCFSYGYFRGFRFHNSNAVSVKGCSADGPVAAGVPQHAGSIGVLIEGSSVDNKFSEMYVAGKTQGYNCVGTSGHTEFVHCDAIACTLGCEVGGSQGVSWFGGLLRNCGYAFQHSSTTSFRIYNPKIRDFLVKPINVAVSSSGLSLFGADFPAPAGGATMADNQTNWLLPSIPSADPLNLPGNAGNVFLVTGTTGFGTLNGGYPGREVTLLFAGALNVLNGSSMRLNGGTFFTTSAGSSLKLVSTGTQWREVGRAV